MRVFVAGATGAIGRPLISALVAQRHEVFGMTTSAGGQRVLQGLGAEGVVADALDAPAVEAALKKIAPQAVIEELTSLPKHYTPEEMRKAAPRDHRLRLEGGRNVQNAATAAGAARYIVQSTGFFYGPGPDLAEETDAFAFGASPGIAAGSRVYAQIEDRVLNAEGMKTAALRYGFFYGPGTYQAEDGDVADQVRRGQYPVIGSGQGVSSFIHIEDAATATVAALDGPPGVYNIVDDDPAPLSVWLPAFARYLGAPAPANVSAEDAERAAGPDAVYYATRLRGASNRKAKRELGFSPRRLEWFAPAARNAQRQDVNALTI